MVMLESGPRKGATNKRMAGLRDVMIMKATVNNTPGAYRVVSGSFLVPVFRFGSFYQLKSLSFINQNLHVEWAGP